MWPTGHRADLSCQCGTKATYEDVSGFSIGSWLRAWDVTHAPCRTASVTPTEETPAPGTDTTGEKR